MATPLGPRQRSPRPLGAAQIIKPPALPGVTDSCFKQIHEQFIGAFVDFVEDVESNDPAAAYWAAQSYSAAVTRWLSLAYDSNI